jgi:hypothetical protein
MDAEVRKMLAERRRIRGIRPPSQKLVVKRYRIVHRMSWSGKDIPLTGGFDDEKAARARMAKLKPTGDECYILFDGERRGGVHGKPLMKKGACEAPAWVTASKEPECRGGCFSVADLLERRIPMPHRAKKSEDAERGRFDSLFEIITPPSPPAAYPTSLAYTGVPVGSPRGVGTSPSASQFVPPVDPARFENYVDGPTIKSRKRGGSSRGRIGSGKVVQQRKERS